LKLHNKAVEYVDKSDGWGIGVGPTVVIVDESARPDKRSN
jgi:hypothetical protein